MGLMKHEQNKVERKSGVAELESKLAEQMRPQGTGISQYYYFFRAYFPAWLLLVGFVLAGGIEIGEVYISIQSEAVNTRTQQAKEYIAEANTAADSSIIDGISATAREKQAEVDNLLQENERMKVEAEAMASSSGGQTLQQRKIKAQVALKSTEAALQKVEADAKNAEDGLRSLEEKAAMTKLVATELHAIDENISAHIASLDMEGPSQQLIMIICGNKYAALIGCPDDYVRRYGNLLETRPAEVAPVPTTPAPEPAITANQPHMRRTKSGANVRPCMSTDNRRCKPDYELGAGDEVNVIQILPDGWAKVEYARDEATRQGYMRLSVFEEE